MAHIKNVVFYRDGGDYGEKQKLYSRGNRAYSYALVLCASVLLGLLSLCIVSEYGDIPGPELFMSYIKSPGIAFLNILPVVCIMFFLYFLTGRSWAAYFITSVLTLGFSVGDYVKLMVRTNPLMASDMRLLSEAGDMASRYTIDFTWRLWLSILAVAFGTAFFAVFVRRKAATAKVRTAAGLCVFALCAVLYVTVYRSDKIYNSLQNVCYEELGLNQWASEHKYISRGFIYPFLHSVKEAFPSKPDGYSQKAAEEIESGYISGGSGEMEEDKKVNIISVMLEAYSDLSRFPELDISDSVYGPLHRVMDEAYSGILISNTFGGGTTDSERTFLTGYTYAENYRGDVESAVSYLADQGYHTEGFHPGDGWFYNRENVNEYLGFESYDFLETVQGADKSDRFFFDYIKERYEERDDSVPYFSYNLSIQNHGAYETGSTCEKSYISHEGLTDYSYNILNNYLEGIADTSARIEEFVNSFKDDDEPVIIIMFGDHMPWMGDSNSVLIDAGINIDTGTEDGFENYYGTMYFIWANDAAEELLGSSFNGEGENMSACFLMPTLFRLAGWEGTPLIKAAEELYEKVSIVNTGSGVLGKDKEIFYEVPDEIAEAFAKFDYLQYLVMHRSA